MAEEPPEVSLQNDDGPPASDAGKPQASEPEESTTEAGRPSVLDEENSDVTAIVAESTGLPSDVESTVAAAVGLSSGVEGLMSEADAVMSEVFIEVEDAGEASEAEVVEAHPDGDEEPTSVHKDEEKGDKPESTSGIDDVANFFKDEEGSPLGLLAGADVEAVLAGEPQEKPEVASAPAQKHKEVPAVAATEARWLRLSRGSVKPKTADSVSSQKMNTIRMAEVMYKPVAQVIQDPTLPLSQRPCLQKILGGSVRGARGGSNRQITELNRQNLLQYKTTCTEAWDPNPAATAPMRATSYQRKKKTRKPSVATEDWQERERKDMERRDHELAEELGYETLVGNIKYIDIPGAKDIQRSWVNFLSADAMEWGFPYEKGTYERPRMKQPEPYLAHQVKEKLWRFPRAKWIQAMQEDSTAV